MKSALQEFIEWGDEMMLKYPMKELGFGQAIDKAEELLKKEEEVLMQYWNGGIACTEEGNPSFDQFHQAQKKEPKILNGYLRETKVWWVVRLAMFETSVHPDDVIKIMQWKKDGIEPEGKYVSFKRVIEKVENTGGRPLVRTFARLIEDEI